MSSNIIAYAFCGCETREVPWPINPRNGISFASKYLRPLTHLLTVFAPTLSQEDARFPEYNDVVEKAKDIEEIFAAFQKKFAEPVTQICF
jgi:hypothetical protein